MPSGACSRSEWVAVAPAPDLGAHPTPVGERVAGRGLAVGRQAHDRAERVGGVLGGVAELAVARGDEEVLPVGREGEAVAEVPVAVDLRRLAPHHLEAVEAGLVPVGLEHRATHDGARAAVARLDPAQVDLPVLLVRRRGQDVAQPALAGVDHLGTPATATRSPVSASRRWSVPLRSVMSRSPVSGRNAIAQGSSSRSSSSTANGQSSSPSPDAGPSEPEAAVSPEQAVASTVSSPASAGARGFMGPWCAGVASAAPVGEGCRRKTSKKSAAPMSSRAAPVRRTCENTPTAPQEE